MACLTYLHCLSSTYTSQAHTLLPANVYSNSLFTYLIPVSYPLTVFTSLLFTSLSFTPQFLMLQLSFTNNLYEERSSLACFMQRSVHIIDRKPEWKSFIIISSQRPWTRHIYMVLFTILVLRMFEPYSSHSYSFPFLS